MKQFICVYIEHSTLLNHEVWNKWFEFCEKFQQIHNIRFNHLGYSADGAPNGVIPFTDLKSFYHSIEDKIESMKDFELYVLPNDYKIASLDVNIYMALSEYYVSIEYSTEENLNVDYESVVKELAEFLSLERGEVNLMNPEDRFVFNIECICLGQDRNTERWKHVQNIKTIPREKIKGK